VSWKTEGKVGTIEATDKIITQPSSYQAIMKPIYILTILFSLVTIPGQSQILFADYSDPDVCEGTKGDYWLTASSFQCTPGLPILHSTDMISWQLVGHALPRLYPIEHYNSVQHGCGVWAPSIRRHGNTYYIYYGDPDYGVYMVKTDNPMGRWDEPVLVVEGRGIIDTCPLWDDDGRMYLVNGWAASRCGFNSVLTIRELSADGTHAIGEPRMVYDGLPDGNHTVEGPKLYKRNGYYYILAPAGGVEHGWQIALRSRNIYGPYESKRVFDADGIHQGGMARKGSSDQFVCFKEVGAYGRVLHLLDIDWKEGWPMMRLSADNKPQPRERSNHDGSALAWQWHANYQDHFGFATPEGFRVYGHPCQANQTLWDVPNLLLRKFLEVSFTDTLHTTVSCTDEGQQSGVVIMGRDYCRLSVTLRQGRFVLSRMDCKDADKGMAEKTAEITSWAAKPEGAGAKTRYSTPLSVVIQCREGGVCTLSYSSDRTHFTTLPQTFQAREGKWIGAKYGIYSITNSEKARGWIDLK